MTDKGEYRQVFALGMPMAVSLCLLETDVMQAFTDAGPPYTFPFCMMKYPSCAVLCLSYTLSPSMKIDFHCT
jgi:hypothetical protein